MNIIITEEQFQKVLETLKEEKTMNEKIVLDVNVGDTVMMGKFKNKKTLVKKIDKDEHGMPTINGKKAATFRIPKKQEETINEVKSNEVDLSSFEEQKTLNDKIWKEDKSLNPKVRRRLLKIADDFLDNIEVDNKLVEDVMFLGSLAGYNWSKYSDIDLHILMDFKKINKDTKLVKDYFDSKKKIWSNEHGSLKIYGFPVEIYIQDVDEKNNSLGKYSIENNEWVKESKPSDKEIDENKIKSKAADLMTEIDKLEKTYNKDLSDEKLTQLSNDVKKIYDKIKQLRKSGLEKNGQFSVGNIVFKVLRRTNYIKKLIDLKIKTYDIINSLK